MFSDIKTKQLENCITCYVHQRKLIISAFADHLLYQAEKTFQADVDIDEIAQNLNNKNFKILQKDHSTIKLKVLCFNIELCNVQNIQIKELENLIKEITQKFDSQVQNLSHKLQVSQLKNAKLAEELQKVQIKLAESQNEWIYFDAPKKIANFIYNTLEEVTFSFESVIGNNIQAKQMKLILFLMTGSQQNTTFQTRTRVINEGKEFPHWTMGYRYPQNAISYNSETVIFPIHKTRQIRVKANHIQPTNCHAMQYFITAYRK